MTSQYSEYAKTYNCTIEEAIRDRDWPLTRNECVKEFTMATGNQPSEYQIRVMRPDRYARQIREEFDSNYNMIYG